MDSYREAARKRLQQARGNNDSNIYIQPKSTPNSIGLEDLWTNISEYRDDESVLENLLVTEASLRDWKAEKQDGDQNTANTILQWATTVISPSENLAGTWDEFQLADEAQRTSIISKYREQRSKSTVGLRLISHLESIISFEEIETLGDILPVLSIFSSPKDPWTTDEGAQTANALLEKCESNVRHKQDYFSAVIENILRRRVKPAFSKTKTPAITPAGRKNVHPVPQPSFDPTLFDPGSKPWKFKEGYIVSILRWIIHRYRATDYNMIERHFPLLVPPILSFIDDESLAFKAEGCKLLQDLLRPLKEAKSDILRRTNLDSVFQDALSHCLLSIPTVTPEKESVHLLSFAYPAIFSVIRTRFSSVTSRQRGTKGQLPTKEMAELEKDNKLRISNLMHILRHNIISSYLHTSSPRPAEDTSISSYPHPYLSTLLLRQLAEAINELEIEATKYLQDIVPLLTSTLTNPFGVAYVPLLITAAQCYHSVILNCWPRLSRWRGDILAGVCACWLHLCDDEEDGMSFSDEGPPDRVHLRLILQRLVKLLKVVVGTDEVVNIDAELQTLVDSDDRLRKLLIL
ncbi:hypothetical protein FQN49_001338 [Arthroderma sp. PD_2]|nr:hypothetical protein FQN49_001338 [Arthroderma sp. PD_2]